MKKTNWYSGTVKPVRAGWYQRRWGYGVNKDYWDGNLWRSGETGYAFETQSIPWRGLTEPAE